MNVSHGVTLPAGPDEVFDWHARPGALERLLPPWEEVRVRDYGSGLRNGSRVTLDVRMPLGLRMRWKAEHYAVTPGRGFCDRQIDGPFTHWEHSHRIDPLEEGRSFLHEEVEFRLPGGFLGALLGNGCVECRLERLLRWRHEVLVMDLGLHRMGWHLPSGQLTEPLSVVVTGASGLIGRALVPFLKTQGNDVTTLLRSRDGIGVDSPWWDPEGGKMSPQAMDALEACNAVVHLAGAPVAQSWTPEGRAAILQSRVESTRLLCRALASLPRPPKVLVMASGVGYYGVGRSGWLDESAGSGEGFLAEVCREWEEAARPAVERGVRVVFLRLGMVLSPAGGALARLLPAFRIGLGGFPGNGRRAVSWAAIDDVVDMIAFTLVEERLAGAVNAISPHVVSWKAFAKKLGGVLKRPVLMPMPESLVGSLGRGMGRELILGGTAVVPWKLQEAGFRYRYARLEDALGHLLGVEP